MSRHLAVAILIAILLAASTLHLSGLICPIRSIRVSACQSVVWAAPRILAQLGGRASGLAVAGHRAYFGHGPRLAVVDISAPDAPRVVATSAPMDGLVYQVALAEGLALASVGNAVQVIDLEDPDRPVLRGRFVLTDTLAAIAGAGRTAFVLAQAGRLHVVDLGDPDAPREIARIEGLGLASDMALSGTTAFVVGNGLHAIDVHDPAHPAVIGDAPIQGYQIALDDDRAYLEGYSAVFDTSAFRVVDVGDPTDMRLELDEISGFIADMVADRGRLHVAWSDAWGPCCGFSTVDLRDLAAPRQLGRLRLSASRVRDLALAGDRLYALSQHGGLRVIDVADPGAPAERAALPILAEVHDAAVQGHLAAAIIGQSNAGTQSPDGRFLSTFDLTVPTAPRELGRVDIGDTAGRVAVAPGLAYVLAHDVLKVADVSDPASPRWLGDYVYEGVGAALVQRDDEAWLAAVPWSNRSGVGFVDGVDVSDPSTPRRLSRFELPAPPSGLALAGDHLYVAERPNAGSSVPPGIRVLEIPSGGGRRETGFVPLPAAPIDVAAGGDRLYVVDSHLRIFDLADPAAPQARGSVALDQPAYFARITVDGDRLYIAGGQGWRGIVVIDAGDPDAPRVVEVIDRLPSRTVAVAPAGESLLLALSEGGMAIVRKLGGGDGRPPALFLPRLVRGVAGD